MKRCRFLGQQGQDLIEFALVLPLLVILLLGIMEFSLLFFSYVSVASAAREGARYGIIHPDDIAGIEAQARDHSPGLDPDRLEISVSYPDADTVQVEVAYDHSFITGLMIDLVGGTPELPLHTVATMYIE